MPKNSKNNSYRKSGSNLSKLVRFNLNLTEPSINQTEQASPLMRLFNKALKTSYWAQREWSKIISKEMDDPSANKELD